MHQGIVGAVRDKLKTEQLLVSIIDTLNHFLPKQTGVRLFYNFLSELWPTDALFYFLVVRGILEQVTNEKIV